MKATLEYDFYMEDHVLKSIPRAVFQQYSLRLMQRSLLWLLHIEHLCLHLTGRLNSLTLLIHENVLAGPLLK